MILSASGWRKVFAESGKGQDRSPEIGETNRALVALIAETFSQYIISKTKKKSPIILLGMDSRPTGKIISDIALKTMLSFGLEVRFLGITSAPEIMAYSRSSDAFMYISASHNPIGHNGIKFGLNDGGVLEAGENAKLIASFKEKCSTSNALLHAKEITEKAKEKTVEKVYSESFTWKKKALDYYEKFIREVITGSKKEKEQDITFNAIKSFLSEKSLTVLCDMNGSSRCESIDRDFFKKIGIGFIAINDSCSQIVHEIIPEPENLVYCQKKMEELHREGKKDILIGYMPDCDGDRGNIVYWDEKEGKAKAVLAQEVFALSVLAETAYSIWSEKNVKKTRKSEKAVAVNCPTSMRIEEICKAMDTKVFRAEVGEANVVHLAREKREEGYSVRILGEGSNGGNITHPSAVRDPLATVFALIKLLTLRDFLSPKGNIEEGLYHMWCEKSGQEKNYKTDFTLRDILDSLPQYTTTGVSEKRAVLNVKTEDKGKLKLRFKKLFENQWKENSSVLFEKYGIANYICVTTNGTKEITGATDWNNGNGGLKIKFQDKDKNDIAFIWMRPSGTENVFRVLCDVKGRKPNMEKSLLAWETEILKKADEI